MDVLELLTRFGLTKQEAKLYWTLLSEGPLTGYEAAKGTGISRSNTYNALAGLVEKGAAYLLEGAAARYTPVDLQEFCDNQIWSLETCKKELLEYRPTKVMDDEGYITVAGETQILHKMKNLVKDAQERVYASMSAELLETMRSQLGDAVQRGLKVVLITEQPFRLPEATIYYTEKGQKQIRLITDSKSVLTGDLSEGPRSTCLYSRKQNLVDLFKESMRNEIKLLEMTKKEGLE